MANPPRICVPIVSASQVIDSVEPLADFFEVRIDLIGKGWRRIAVNLKKPWIACNRRLEEGGRWSGNEAKRIKELIDALDIGAYFIDIELGTPAIEQITKEVKGRAEIIVSYHNLEETPPLDRLRQIIINQLAAGADICKVVTTARSLKDNIEVLKLINVFPEVKIISFAMGPAGQISRIICPLAGGYLTWASSEEGRESAAGQLSVRELRELYRMMGER